MHWHTIVEKYHEHLLAAQQDILFGIVVLFTVSAVVVAIVQRFRQSTVIGYLLTGFLIGPHALGLIGDTEVIDILATLGVILLMFTLGIEFSVKKLLRIRTVALGGGTLQVLLTIGGVMALASLMGRPLYSGVFLGCVVAMSSSAIVLKIISDRGEMDAPYAKVSLGILILQDLCVVPMMIILPAMGAGGQVLAPLAIAIVKAVVFLGVAILLAELALPRLLYYVASTKSKELFLLTIMALCLGTAWVTSLFGLSLALGAFLAGLLVSESEYSYEIFSDVIPFKDGFLSVFFISVGMLLDPLFVWHKAGVIAVVVAMILFGKMVITALVVLVFRHSVRTALLTAFSLAQIGEFSFVLVRMGVQNKLVGETFYQVTLASAIATMILTPGLIQLAHWLCERLSRVGKLEGFFETEADSRLREAGRTLSDHVIVCGYGPIGRNLCKALRASHIPFMALELNPATVQELAASDTPVYYGDASSATILKMAGVERAAAVAITVPDPVATRTIVRRVRKLNPQAKIITRAKYLRDMQDLLALGAHEVIHEEFEASLEVVQRTLRQLGVADEAIAQSVRQMREGVGRAT